MSASYDWTPYKLIYQIGNGWFELVGGWDWLSAEWNNIKFDNRDAKIISFEPIDQD